MSNQPNFGAILDQPASNVEPPKALPVGSYVCLVKGLPRCDKSSKKQTEFVEFTLQFMQAGEDVDEEALTSALTKPSGERVNLSEKTIRATYYCTEDALWRLKKFLVDLQIYDEEATDDDRTLRQLIDEAPGRQVLISLKHRTSDSGGIFAEIGSTAAVE